MKLHGAGMMLSVLAFAALLPCAAPAPAQVTAKQLAEWCATLGDIKRDGTKVTVPQDFRAGYCMGFFDTLRYEDRIARGAGQPQFCPPRGGDASALIRTFTSYLEANPGEGGGQALAVARKALARTWPCKAQPF